MIRSFADAAQHLIGTFLRHVAKLVAVEADRVVALSGEMFCTAAFAAGIHLVIMVET